MPITREPVQLDPSTFLIDTGGMGVWNYTGVYLIEAEKRCLIDAGNRGDAPRVIQTESENASRPLASGGSMRRSANATPKKTTVNKIGQRTACRICSSRSVRVRRARRSNTRESRNRSRRAAPTVPRRISSDESAVNHARMSFMLQQFPGSACEWKRDSNREAVLVVKFPGDSPGRIPRFIPRRRRPFLV